MREEAALRPAPLPRRPVELHRVVVPSPEFSRFLYTAVGGDWYWTDRLPWTYSEWQRWVDRPELSTWVAAQEGSPAGYFELEVQPLPGDDTGTQVEISAFGLLPQFRGAGVGGWLLTEALRRAWALGPRRVWVNTCSLDGPAALPNYRARGLTVYEERTVEKTLAPQPPGPWPGARI
ncbi:MAG: GNAT family N-acetyltransferase [Candidatus Dormibacteraeota bacterium]|nr:GNAT family N-acetyltransferase [Candidatus Dormibacteraeota bacterium]